MSIYDNIHKILKTNPLTSFAYNAGASVGTTIRNQAPSVAQAAQRAVSSIPTIPVSLPKISIPSSGTSSLNLNLPKINLPSVNLPQMNLQSANVSNIARTAIKPALALAVPATKPISASLAVSKQVIPSLVTGYESANKTLSNVTKRVLPSYQETGYMYNKLVADPLYGKSVQKRTGLLPSENWVATTSPGAMAGGGLTVITKNQHGDEVRTRYGFNNNNTLSSNIMGAVTGFAEGGWNMPRERPLDTIALLATAGVGEVATGTVTGAKLLAKPAAKYALGTGLGVYGADVSKRVYGDDPASRSSYDMSKRLGGITTTELAPGSVVLSPFASRIRQGIVSAQRSAGITKTITGAKQMAKMVGVDDILMLPSGNVKLSSSEEEIVRMIRPGAPEYGTAHSPKKDVGWVRGLADEVHTPGYEHFDGVPRDQVVFTHSHPPQEFQGLDDPDHIFYTIANANPSGEDLGLHLTSDATSQNRILSRLSPDIAHVTVMHGIHSPTTNINFREIPTPSNTLNRIANRVGAITGDTTPNKPNFLRRSAIVLHEVEYAVGKKLNKEPIKQLIKTRNAIQRDVATYGRLSEQAFYDAGRTYQGERGFSTGQVKMFNDMAKRDADNLRNILRNYGGDITYHKINLRTGEQQQVDYPTIAKISVTKDIPGYYSDYYLMAPKSKRTQRYATGKKPTTNRKKKPAKKTPRRSLSTGTSIEKKMSRNVNRFLGW